MKYETTSNLDRDRKDVVIRYREILLKLPNNTASFQAFYLSLCEAIKYIWVRIEFWNEVLLIYPIFCPISCRDFRDKWALNFNEKKFWFAATKETFIVRVIAMFGCVWICWIAH